MAFAVVIGALILLVVLHELGHLLAARMVGIRATKFYVFFPPALFKRRIGDVEWGIGAIPAGGFVKLPGMFRPTAEEIAARVHWEIDQVLEHVNPDQRLQLDAARRTIAGMDDVETIPTELEQVLEVLDDARASSATAAPGHRQLQRAYEHVLNCLDDLHPGAYWRAALWRRMTVIVAGPLVNLLVAFVVLVAFHAALEPTWKVTSPLRLDEVTAAGPAARAGIDMESRIVAWNGPIEGADPGELVERIRTGVGKPVELVWLTPDGTRREARVVPERLDDDEVPRIGVTPALVGSSRALDVERVGRVDRGVFESVELAGRDMWQISWGNLSRLPRVFFDSEIREDVGSVVGIVDVADEVDRAGQIVWYVAIISLILAVMNLLPLLPLDGGHLLFGLLEALRRRPMPRAAFERYSMVGLALVLLLFFIGLNNDIGRMTG